jgi:plasmid segregation protein ParM
MQIVNDLKILPPPWVSESDIYEVYIDDGYDQNKVGYWADVNGVKAFVAFKFRTSVQMGRAFTSVSGGTSGIYEVDGVSYSVSDYVDNEVPRNKGFAFSEYKGALIHHALKLAGFGGLKVALSTTLPLGFYYKNGVVDKAYIEKVKNSLQKPYTSLDGEPLADIVAEHHTIQPESVCAFIAYVLRNGDDQFEDIEGSFCVCDVGGNTTDISVLVPGDEIRIAHDLSGSKSIGVLNVKDALSKALEDQFGVANIPPAALSKALATKRFDFLNKSTDISNLVDSSLLFTAKRLLHYIDEMVGDYSLNHIMFSGGGAEVLKDAIASVYPNAITTEHSEFDNLKGLMLSSQI